MALTVEILIDHKVNIKGHRMLSAMAESADAAGVKATVTREYRGAAHVLMMYGVGHPVKMIQWKDHLLSGRPCVGWDLGYYGRGDNDSYPMRLTINAFHPQHLMADDADPSRWDATAKPLRNEFNPDGHIVLCGMGRKSRHQYGIDGNWWERKRLEQLKRAYPGVPLIYRPKSGATETVGIRMDVNSPIETVIRGARMVVVRHSNVAIDACLAGIPVVCEDGAASKLYGADICNPKNPSAEERLRFLRSLAWWQYRPTESMACWQHILSVLTSAQATSARPVGSQSTQMVPQT